MSSKSRLNGVDAQILEEAQRELERLCSENELEPLNINVGKGPWKELVLRIIGVPPVKNVKGRSDEEIFKIGFEMDVYDDFHPDNEDRFRIKRVTRQRALFPQVLKKHKIKKQNYAHGHQSSDFQIGKGIWQRYLKLKKKQMDE